jgi:hypothetical protein
VRWSQKAALQQRKRKTHGAPICHWNRSLVGTEARASVWATTPPKQPPPTATTFAIYANHTPPISTATNLCIPPTTSATIWHHRLKKSTDRQPPTSTLASTVLSITTAKIPRQYRPSQISDVLRSHHCFNRRGRCYPHQVAYHFSWRRHNKLVLTTSVKMHIFLAATEGKVLAELPRFPNGA